MARKGIPRPTGPGHNQRNKRAGTTNSAPAKRPPLGAKKTEKNGTSASARSSQRQSRPPSKTAATGKTRARGIDLTGRGANTSRGANQRKPASTSRPAAAFAPWKSRGKTPEQGSAQPPSAGATSIWMLLQNRSFLTAVAVVLAVAVALYGGYNIYRSVSKAMENLNAQPDHIGVGATAPPIVDCKPADLKTEFVDPPTTIKVGGDWNAKLRITNIGTSDCLYNGSAANLGIDVKSADVQVATSVGCSPDADARPLLFAAGQKWETTLTWNGRLSANCTSGDPAKAGTYVVTFALGGKLTETAATVTLK